jgi:DNA/RNA endonuclease YhcR with UshA esterase domain
MIFSRCVAFALSALMGLAASVVPAAAEMALTSAQAGEHIGERATVCGIVASTRYLAKSTRQPTFLNFDQPYPRQVFTVVIWGSDRAKFGAPETTLMGRRVCVTGTIEAYRGMPEIIARDPSQLTAR